MEHQRRVSFLRTISYGLALLAIGGSGCHPPCSGPQCGDEPRPAADWCDVLEPYLERVDSEMACLPAPGRYHAGSFGREQDLAAQSLAACGPTSDAWRVVSDSSDFASFEYQQRHVLSGSAGLNLPIQNLDLRLGATGEGRTEVDVVVRLRDAAWVQVRDLRTHLPQVPDACDALCDDQTQLVSEALEAKFEIAVTRLDGRSWGGGLSLTAGPPTSGGDASTQAQGESRGLRFRVDQSQSNASSVRFVSESAVTFAFRTVPAMERVSCVPVPVVVTARSDHHPHQGIRPGAQTVTELRGRPGARYDLRAEVLRVYGDFFEPNQGDAPPANRLRAEVQIDGRPVVRCEAGGPDCRDLAAQGGEVQADEHGRIPVTIRFGQCQCEACANSRPIACAAEVRLSLVPAGQTGATLPE